jgi:hypothetical protein
MRLDRTEQGQTALVLSRVSEVWYASFHVRAENPPCSELNGSRINKEGALPLIVAQLHVFSHAPFHKIRYGIRDFVSTLKSKEKLSEKTISRKLTALQNYFTWLVGGEGVEY